MCSPALLVAAVVALPAGAVGTSQAPGGERGLVLLERPGSPREEATLLEALRIYTRDLAVSLRSAVMPPGTISGSARAKAALASCGTDVAVVLWFTGDDLQLNALSCDSRTLRAAPLAPAEDLDLAAQTLALKVRGLLARIPSVEREEWQPVGPPPPDGEKTPALPPAPAPGDDGKRGPPAASGGLEVRAAWGVSSGTDSTWLRQGAVIGLSLALRRLPFDLGLEGGINLRVNAEPVTGARVSLREVPLALSVGARFGRGRSALSIGPRLALHLMQLEAQRPSAGQWGRATQASAGLGGAVQLRYDIWRDVGVVLGATAEVLLPRQRFVSGSQTLVDLGYWHWGVNAGLVYRLF